MLEEVRKSETEKAQEREMREYGVTRTSNDYFHVDGFRYTALKDAVAQAKRPKAKS
jgi:hypothetical protein